MSASAPSEAPHLSQSSKVVVITRPQVVASSDVQRATPHVHLSHQPSALELALEQKGHSVQHVPLIDIHGPPEPQIIEQMAGRLNEFRAIMFVSPQAVAHFFGHLKYEMAHWVTPCWVTGGGSQAALLRVGVKASLIFQPNDGSGVWDSEHLWRRVESLVSPGQRVLIVRGKDDLQMPKTEGSSGDQSAGDIDHGTGREYLSQKLQQKGLQVSYVVAYQRCSPVWDPAQCMRARELLGPSCVWLFTSSQAAKNLAQLLMPVDFSKALAIATHERIAKELRYLGFGVVLLSLPGAQDVMRSLESLA